MCVCVVNHHHNPNLNINPIPTLIPHRFQKKIDQEKVNQDILQSVRSDLHDAESRVTRLSESVTKLSAAKLHAENRYGS